MKPHSLELELLYPILLALDDLGGSGGIDEIDDWVIERKKFGEGVTSPIQGKGPRTVFQYRMAWARTILKNLRLVASGGRGVWMITDSGMRLIEKPDPELELKELNQSRRGGRGEPPQGFPRVPVDELEKDPLQSFARFASAVEEEDAWKPELLDTIMSLSPRGFEHLSLRLLREQGIENLQVTGGPRDGGIDGEGVMRLGLLRFPVVFQCKRYIGSVGASAVRDFRGAVQGRTDKGLLITTGRFTHDASTEAKRPGATAIDLIDGDDLCELMRGSALGLKSVTRLSLDDAFFDDYRDL